MRANKEEMADWRTCGRSVDSLAYGKGYEVNKLAYRTAYKVVRRKGVLRRQ